MTLGNIDTKISELTKADTTVAYPTANRLINVNIWNQKITTMILEAQDSSDFDDSNQSGYAVLESDLVANQRDYNFGISNGVVEIKRVEVTYDGVKSNVAQPIDSSEIPYSLDEGTTEIDSHFGQSYPGYDWKFNSIWLYPKPTVELGKVMVQVSRTSRDFTSGEYTTGTLTPGFDTNFHHMLAYGAAYDYFLASGNVNMSSQLASMLAMDEQKIKKQYGKKDRDYPLRFQSEFINYN